MLVADQKILFLAKVITFLNLENTGNYSLRTDFNRVFPKMAIFGISKPIFYIFYPIILKLNLVVFGVNWELLLSLEFRIRPLLYNVGF